MPSSTKAQLKSSQARILTLLKQLDQPISAQEIYVELHKLNQSLGLATVYRILKALKLKGLVQARTSVSGECLYSSVEEHEHYLTCLHCSKAIPIEKCPVCQLETTLRQSQLYTIYYHTLEFFGLCSACQHQIETGM